MAEKQQKKKKGRSVQELLGIRTFTKYGLAVATRLTKSSSVKVNGSALS